MSVLSSILACPIDKNEIATVEDGFRCTAGHWFVLEDGIPVFTKQPRRELVPQNMPPCQMAQGTCTDRFVNDWIVNTNGNLYWRVRGNLPRYPIPEWPFRKSSGDVLVDLGCSWGRWCVSASRSGFKAVGLDVHLDALAAATRVAKEVSASTEYACADIEALPIRSQSVDVVFSFSVLQHLDKAKVARVFAEASRILKPGGSVVFQLPNAFGPVSFLQQLRRGFRSAHDDSFEMRYWTRKEICDVATRARFEDIRLEPHSFYSQNPQTSDLDMLSAGGKSLVLASRASVALAQRVPFLTSVADSIWVHARRI